MGAFLQVLCGDGLDLGGALAVDDHLVGVHKPLGHAGVLEAHHHPLESLLETEVDQAGDLTKLLEELLDDDGLLPAGGQVLGLEEDLVGEGLLGLGHAEVLEGVELPLALGSGDGKQQVVSAAEGAGRLETDEAEVGAGVVAEEADVAKPGEGLGDILLLQEGGASALESEANLWGISWPDLWKLLR